MGAVQGVVLPRVADADRVGEQVAGAVPDVLADLVHAQRRQSTVRPDVVDAGGDGVVTVGQGAVEVEQNRLDVPCVIFHLVYCTCEEQSLARRARKRGLKGTPWYRKFNDTCHLP